MLTQRVQMTAFAIFVLGFLSLTASPLRAQTQPKGRFGAGMENIRLSDGTRAVEVKNVTEGKPASNIEVQRVLDDGTKTWVPKQKMAVGDVITTFDGVKVTNIDEVAYQINVARSNEWIIIKGYNRGKLNEPFTARVKFP